MSRQLRKRKPRIGSRVINAVGTTVESAEHVIHEGLHSIGAGFTGIANTMEELVVESADDLQQTKMDCALNNKDRHTALIEAGYSDDEATAILNVDRRERY